MYQGHSFLFDTQRGGGTHLNLIKADFKNCRRNSKEAGSDFDERLKRIRGSISRINTLMQELRAIPHVAKKKEEKDEVTKV
jgi:hypothetical protein